jgi:hypothetical protein
MRGTGDRSRQAHDGSLPAPGGWETTRRQGHGNLLQ